MIEDEEEEATEVEPSPWSWITFWSILAASVGGYFSLVAMVFSSVSDRMDSHVAYGKSRRAMQEQAAKEIEAMTQAMARG